MLDHDSARAEKPTKILVALAGAEPALGEALLAGARAKLDGFGAEVEVIRLSRVRDVPQALALAERMQEFDGYVALGVVTGRSHVERALMGLGMSGGLVGIGLVAAEGCTAEAATLEGGAAAVSVLELIGLARAWAGKSKGIGFRA